MFESKLPLDPYFSAAKLGWLLQNIPAVKSAHAAGTLRLGTTDAFFLDRLTGRFVTDVTTASRTSLMNLQTLSWDPVLCAVFGVPMACLPDIVTTTGDFGVVETRYGATPVTASIVDQQAALYGFGCRTAGDAKITFGTGAFALMVAGTTVVSQDNPVLLPTVTWQMSGQPPVYALEGGVFAASAAINWARSLGLFCDFSNINNFDAPPAIASGLAFVPALSGLGCPHWVSGARGVWLGLSLDHSPQQLVQSILEGVALRAVEVIEALDACVPLPGGLEIDGGLSKNPYFAKFLADVSGRQVRAAVMPEMTGQGVLQLAGMQLGEPFNFASDATIYASESTDGFYRERFARAVSMSKTWSGT